MGNKQHWWEAVVNYRCPHVDELWSHRNLPPSHNFPQGSLSVSPMLWKLNNIWLLPEQRSRDKATQDIPSLFNTSFLGAWWSLIDKPSRNSLGFPCRSQAAIKAHKHNNKAVNPDPAVLYELKNSPPAVKSGPCLDEDAGRGEEGSKGCVISGHIGQPQESCRRTTIQSKTLPDETHRPTTTFHLFAIF